MILLIIFGITWCVLGFLAWLISFLYIEKLSFLSFDIFDFVIVIPCILLGGIIFGFIVKELVHEIHRRSSEVNK